MDFVPKLTWQDSPSTATPITAAELIRMENGIAEGARDATELQRGNVELASSAEMTTGTDANRVPSVLRVANYVSTAIANAIAALPGVASATESVAGIVELATATEMTTGTDLTRAPSVKRVADYVISSITALSNSIDTLLDGKANSVHTHTSSDISGTLSLDKIAPGAVFIINYVSGAWKYNNATITTRPSTRADIRMWAIGGSTAPGFALTHDLFSPET